MARTFTNFQEVLDYLVEQNAEIRGEALAARVMVAYALGKIVSDTSDQTTALEKFWERAKETVELATSDGQGEPRLVGLQKARALQRIEETVEEIRRVLGLRSGHPH